MLDRSNTRTAARIVVEACKFRATWVAAVVFISGVLLAAGDARAQVDGSRSYSFQGYLESGGAPIADGSYTIDFKARWFGQTSPFQSGSAAVDVVGGVFGLRIPLPLAMEGPALEVQYTVKDGGNTTLLTSDWISVLSVPYAFSLGQSFRLHYPGGGDIPNIIGGDANNWIDFDSQGSTISGGGKTPGTSGDPNLIVGNFNTIGGGSDHLATDDYGTIGGGLGNESSGYAATVAGGSANKASGRYAAVAGGAQNVAQGWNSFAAGTEAKALHDGSFVWSDPTGGPLESTGQNQFILDADGGIGLNTNDPRGHVTIARPAQQPDHQLELRTYGGINDTGYDGIRFSQFESNGNENTLGAIELGYLNTGRTTMDFLLRNRDPGMTLSDTGLGIGIPASRALHVRKDGVVRIDREEPAGTSILLHQYSGATPWKTFQILADADGVDSGYLDFADMGTAVSGAGTSRMRILNNGNVGIGSTTPAYKLDVNGTIRANNVSATSDGRFKRDVEELTGSLGLVSSLQGIRYSWDRESYPEQAFDDGRHLGFIAQEVEAVIPEIVSRDDMGMRSVSYGEVVPLLVEAVKELAARVEAQQAEIEALKAQ